MHSLLFESFLQVSLQQNIRVHSSRLSCRCARSLFSYELFLCNRLHSSVVLAENIGLLQFKTSLKAVNLSHALLADNIVVIAYL